MGNILLEAKSKLPHGQWLPWIEQDLRIGIRSAQILMFIARHPVISNATQESYLPPSPRTLYELCQLRPERLEQLINTGKVHSGLEREQAIALRRGTDSKQGRSSIAPKLRRELVPLLQACLSLGGPDVILGHIRRIPDWPELPTAKEFDCAARWVKRKIVTQQRTK
jgi:hypothetical protein